MELKKYFMTEIAKAYLSKNKIILIAKNKIQQSFHRTLRNLFTSCSREDFRLLAISYPTKKTFFKALGLKEKTFNDAIAHYISGLRRNDELAKKFRLNTVVTALKTATQDRLSEYLDNFVPQSLKHSDRGRYIKACLDLISTEWAPNDLKIIAMYYSMLSEEDIKTFVDYSKREGFPIDQNLLKNLVGIAVNESNSLDRSYPLENANYPLCPTPNDNNENHLFGSLTSAFMNQDDFFTLLEAQHWNNIGAIPSNETIPGYQQQLLVEEILIRERNEKVRNLRSALYKACTNKTFINNNRTYYSHLRKNFMRCNSADFQLLVTSYPTSDNFFEAIGLSQDTFHDAFVIYKKRLSSDNLDSDRVILDFIIKTVQMKPADRIRCYLTNFVQSSLYQIDDIQYMETCLEAIKKWSNNNRTMIARYLSDLPEKAFRKLVGFYTQHGVDFGKEICNMADMKCLIDSNLTFYNLFQKVLQEPHTQEIGRRTPDCFAHTSHRPQNFSFIPIQPFPFFSKSMISSTCNTHSSPQNVLDISNPSCSSVNSKRPLVLYDNPN
ncbi:MAG: hypothetical protein H2069_06095 [Legionella sp.]|nr:hypothetical protein [Legionella sp.]